MNSSIRSYSGGKLTIRRMHVHIVMQCHSFIGKHSKKLSDMLSVKVLSPFTSFYSRYPVPPLFFPSSVPPSFVYCLTFFDLTVTRDYDTIHISTTSQISNRTVSIIIHNLCVRNNGTCKFNVTVFCSSFHIVV